VSVAHPRK